MPELSVATPRPSVTIGWSEPHGLNQINHFVRLAPAQHEEPRGTTRVLEEHITRTGAFLHTRSDRAGVALLLPGTDLATRTSGAVEALLGSNQLDGAGYDKAAGSIGDLRLGQVQVTTNSPDEHATNVGGVFDTSSPLPPAVAAALSAAREIAPMVGHGTAQEPTIIGPDVY